MKQKIRDAQNRLRLTHPWLRMIDNDTLHIGERLRRIEDGYFIVFNTKSNHYEVHSADNKAGRTYCFLVPFDTLDQRTIDRCIETRIENTDKLLKQMEKDNEEIKRKSKRDFENSIESASYETATDLKLAMEKDELHSGYKRTFGGATL